MGLRATIASAVGTAFNAIGDIVETITYRSRTDGIYNAATGVVSHADTDTSIQAVVEAISGEQDANVIAGEHSGDLMFTFKQSQLSGDPDTGDEIVRGGETYTVNKIEFDPAGATFMVIGSRQG